MRKDVEKKHNKYELSRGEGRVACWVCCLVLRNEGRCGVALELSVVVARERERESGGLVASEGILRVKA